MSVKDVIDQRFNCESGGAVNACSEEGIMHSSQPDEWSAGASEEDPNFYVFLRLDDDSMGIRPKTKRDELVPELKASQRSPECEHGVGPGVLDELFAILSEKFFDYDLACLFAVRTTGDVTSVTVCNSWRLTKCAGSPRIDCEDRDFKSGGWKASIDSYVPQITLLPETASPVLAREMLEQAVVEFVRSYNDYTMAERAVLAEARKAEVSYLDLEHALAKTWIGCLEEYVGARKLESLSQTLSEVIWKFLIDPDFIKVVACARTGSHVGLCDYWKMSQSHASCTRLYWQDRKMLPLFEHLSEEEFEKPELFSIKRWTEEGVEFAWTGKTRLAGPASYRALMATEPAIVRSWADAFARDGAFAFLFDLQGAIADEGPIPSPVLLSIAHPMNPPDLDMGKYWDSYVRLIRLYVRECRRRIALPEVHTYEQVVESIAFANIFHWWRREGSIDGEPNRQTTWSDIEGKSNRWYRQWPSARAPS